VRSFFPQLKIEGVAPTSLGYLTRSGRKERPSRTFTFRFNSAKARRLLLQPHFKINNHDPPLHHFRILSSHFPIHHHHPARAAPTASALPNAHGTCKYLRASFQVALAVAIHPCCPSNSCRPLLELCLIHLPTPIVPKHRYERDALSLISDATSRLLYRHLLLLCFNTVNTSSLRPFPRQFNHHLLDCTLSILIAYPFPLQDIHYSPFCFLRSLFLPCYPPSPLSYQAPCTFH